MCIREDHNWVYSNGFRVCKYCGLTEANLKGPIEVAEIKPYNYGQSSKPLKIVAFGAGLLLFLVIITIVLSGIIVVITIFGG